MANPTPTGKNLEKFGKMQLLVKLLQRNIEKGLETKPLRRKIAKIGKNAVINQIITAKY
ncbi:MAG: hypothetical protein AB4080_10825 [Trichodesmium sp.]